MRITKRQLRRIIRERAALTNNEIVQYLEDNAENYHQDSALDAKAIAILLRDDFMDDIGADTPLTDEYENLIVDLSQGSIVEGKILYEQVSDTEAESIKMIQNWYDVLSGLIYDEWAATGVEPELDVEEVTYVVEALTSLTKDLKLIQITAEEEEKKYAAGRPWEHN